MDPIEEVEWIEKKKEVDRKWIETQQPGPLTASSNVFYPYPDSLSTFLNLELINDILMTSKFIGTLIYNTRVSSLNFF